MTQTININPELYSQITNLATKLSRRATLGEISAVVNKNRDLTSKEFIKAENSIIPISTEGATEGIYFLFQYRTVKTKLSFNLIKIGYSDNLKSRINQLQSGNPNKLYLLECIPIPDYNLERAVQIHFIKHYKEKEWFYYTKEIEDFILKIKNLKNDINKIRNYLEKLKIICLPVIKPPKPIIGKKIGIKKPFLVRKEMMEITNFSRTHLVRLLKRYNIKPVPTAFSQKLLYSRKDFKTLIKKLSESKTPYKFLTKINNSTKKSNPTKVQKTFL